MHSDLGPKCAARLGYRLVSCNCVDSYLTEIRRLWPQNLFYYREEIALMYLAFKSYQVDKALTSIYFNNEELIQLIKIEH